MHKQQLSGSSRSIAWVTVVCSLVALLLFESCGTSQPVRVLQPGQRQLSVSLGGPIVPSSSPVGFIPYLDLGYVVGVSSDYTLQANVHALPAVFGTLGADLGIATRLCHEQSWQPELSLKAQGIFFTDFRAARIYPLLSLLGSYEVSSRSLAYGGLETLYQFHDSRLFCTPLLGYSFPLSAKTTMQTEFKWMAANVSSASGVFEGEGSIGSHGGIGFFLGLNYEL